MSAAEEPVAHARRFLQMLQDFKAGKGLPSLLTDIEKVAEFTIRQGQDLEAAREQVKKYSRAAALHHWVAGSNALATTLQLFQPYLDDNILTVDDRLQPVLVQILMSERRCLSEKTVVMLLMDNSLKNRWSCLRDLMFSTPVDTSRQCACGTAERCVEIMSFTENDASFFHIRFKALEEEATTIT